MEERDPMATLAVLERARASLAGGPFSFHDWAECTCGHLYAGAGGAPASRRPDVRQPQPDTQYAATVVHVAQVLSGDPERFSRRPWWDPRSRPALAARWISDRTLRRARLDGRRVARADALEVLDEAILAFRALEQPVLADVHERRLVA
jgi:hypothetical protein